VIRLYRARFSTNVERVALALALKGLEAESVWITYEDRSPVEQVSGQPLVPVLDYEGEILV
jgi:glutathione S-transferase